MARGSVPWELVESPRLDRPMGDIYRMLDCRTDEVQPDEESMFWRVTLFVALPPMWYQGRFIKGICFTDAADLLVDQFPKLREAFFVFAYSMWSSYAWSQKADGLFTLYPNAEREAWFRKTNPDRADQILVPAFDSDWMNEYVMYPRTAPKDIDVLCVSRLDRIKNVPMVARAMRAYRKKYNERIMLHWVTGTDFDINLKGMAPWEREAYQNVEKELDHVADYINVIPKHADMPMLYSRAKVYVLGSLFEGKNRGIEEATACDTPVVCFADYNHYARNGYPLFPTGCGLVAKDFDAECLADTLHQALHNLGDFTPRVSGLTSFGRRQMFNQLMDILPYYRTHIPDYIAGNMHNHNWLENGVLVNYQTSLHDFIYGRHPYLAHQMGLDSVKKQIEGYMNRFRFYLDKI